MGIIAKLDAHTINGIAAGEVVERPASVVKELIDNALDAGADAIHITIKAGGVRQIRVQDNGRGMAPDDVRMAVLSHTTSKLTSLDDLTTLSSLGFRGEALASIAAVSRLTLDSREIGSDAGYRLIVEGGVTTYEGPKGLPEGTTIDVADLFYNTPARYKFLKSDKAEAASVIERVARLALARPDVSFRLDKDGVRALQTPGNGDLIAATHAVFGAEIGRAVRPMHYVSDTIQIDGLITPQDAYSRPNRTRQVVIVNGRVVTARVIQAAIDEASSGFFIKGRHPAVIAVVTVPPSFVDVNVHPQKSEVRFAQERAIFHALYHAAVDALGRDPAARVDTTDSYDSKPESPEGVPSSAHWAEAPHGARRSGAPKPSRTDNRSLFAPPLWDRRDQIGDDARSHATLASEAPADQVHASHPTVPMPHAQTLSDVTSTYTVDKTAPSSQTRAILALAHAKVLGQYLNTYIVMQIDDRLVLLDQHAAHERILYERFLQAEEDQMTSQTLLVPLHIEVTPEEAAFVEAHSDLFHARGFDVEPFGHSALVVRALPASAHPIDAKRLVTSYLSAVMESDAAQSRLTRERFASLACKAAAKGHQALSEGEIQALLDDLQTLNDPYRCPHGRPILISWTKRDVEVRFGRTV